MKASVKRWLLDIDYGLLNLQHLVPIFPTSAEETKQLSHVKNNKYEYKPFWGTISRRQWLYL